MKKIDWQSSLPAKTIAENEAWWYGQPNSIWIGIGRKNGPGLAHASIPRHLIERWLKEVKPKRKKR